MLFSNIANLSFCSIDDSFFQAIISLLNVTYVIGQYVTYVLGSYPQPLIPYRKIYSKILNYRTDPFAFPLFFCNGFNVIHNSRTDPIGFPRPHWISRFLSSVFLLCYLFSITASKLPIKYDFL